MRHRQTTPSLNRSPSHRKAMFRNMVTALLRHEKIRTTSAKAKALRPIAEKLITLGKRESVHARRHAARFVRDKAVVKKLFDDLAPRYAERPGGYTRIIKLSARPGDAADMAVIELVEAEIKAKKPKKSKKRKGGPRTAAQDTAAAAAEVVEAEADEATEEAAAEVEDAVDTAAEDADAGEDSEADSESEDKAGE